MLDMALPPRPGAVQSDYHMLRLPQRGRRVIEAHLNCSEMTRVNCSEMTRGPRLHRGRLDCQHLELGFAAQIPTPQSAHLLSLPRPREHSGHQQRNQRGIGNKFIIPQIAEKNKPRPTQGSLSARGVLGGFSRRTMGAYGALGGTERAALVRG
jgi:hypothetical protein